MKRLIVLVIIILLFLYCVIKDMGFKRIALEQDMIEVDIVYHDKRERLKVSNYANLESVLAQIVLADDVDYERINPQMIMKHKDQFILPIKSPRACVSINSADHEQLMTLKGVGESVAQRIIDYRNEHGLYQSIEDLMKVKGIGIKKFEAMKEALCL